MAVVVVLFLLGGAVAAANFDKATSPTVQVQDDHSIDVVQLEPVPTMAPTRYAIMIVMPSINEPIAAAFAPRTFRPPRG